MENEKEGVSQFLFIIKIKCFFAYFEHIQN